MSDSLAECLPKPGVHSERHSCIRHKDGGIERLVTGHILFISGISFLGRRGRRVVQDVVTNPEEDKPDWPAGVDPSCKEMVSQLQKLIQQYETAMLRLIHLFCPSSLPE